MAPALEERILTCLEEKPRSISEIARELDEEKYEISKKIEVLSEQGHINTYRIGRSTACILATDDEVEEGEAEANAEEHAEAPADDPDPIEKPDPVTPDHLENDVSEQSRRRSSETNSLSSGIERVAATAEETVDNAVTSADVETYLPESSRSDGPRTIGIVSGKGGVGKTVVTLNLGAAMMDMGESVIVMDSDAEMPNVGLHLGMYTYPTSLAQVVEQDVHIMSAMHVDKDSGLRVIPTAISAEPRTEDVKEALQQIPEEYIVLIDSPPGYERPVERVIETCDELIFVTTPEIPSVTDTYKLYKEAEKRGKKVLGVVINQYSSPKKHLSVKEVEKSLELPVLGVINESKVIQQSIFDNQPAVSWKPNAKPSRSFKQIAADLTGNSYEASLMDRVKGLLP